MIRIFVGCDPNHCDVESQAVLEWSIRKHASQPVQIEWMKLSRDPESFWYSNGAEGWNTEQWATTFSAFRWGIPARCGFEGRAIYCDSDVIFMSDVAGLWRQEFQAGKCVMGKGGGSWRLCVSLWDCAVSRSFILPIEALRAQGDSHARMTARLMASNVVQSFVGNWNCLDGELYESLSAPDIKAIHYTSIGTQPQLRFAVPRLEAAGRKHWFNGEIRDHWRKDLIQLFDELLAEATAEGYGPARYLQDPPYGDVRKRDMAKYMSGRKS